MKEKLQVLAVAYPEYSRTYANTCCIAGITEDGNWRRLFPVPFPTYYGLKGGKKRGIQKRGWIEYELMEDKSQDERDDKRKESTKIKYQSIRKVGDPITAEELRDILRPQVTTRERLKEKYDDDFTSLGVIKPELIDMGFKENKAYKGDRQTNLASKIIQVTQLKYKPQYHFRCNQSENCNTHHMICEDIEAGELYRRYIDRDDIRQEKMRERLFDFMLKRDLYFIVGTHRWYPTWLVIGLLYPLLPEGFQQTKLAG